VRTETRQQLVHPPAGGEPDVELPADAGLWPSAVAAELRPALDSLLIPDRPLRPAAPEGEADDLRLAPQVRFQRRGEGHLEITFLEALPRHAGLELRLPPEAAAPATITYEYAR